MSSNDGVTVEEFLLSAPLHPGNSLTCPECGAPTNVKDSRPKVPYNFTTMWRRRECTGCGIRFNTIEVSIAVYEALDNVRSRACEAEN